MNFAEADPKGYFSNRIDTESRLLLTRIGNFLAGQNIESYLVGGFVRDVLLGRETADIDVAVSPDALEITPKIATALGGKYVPLDEINKVGRVVLVDKESAAASVPREIDFSTFQGNIEQDLARRDFTIDAMAIELKQLTAHPNSTPSGLIDPFQGQDDLRQGIIRVVTDTAFASDAARLLRAVRLAAELGFTIDQKTETLIKHHAHLTAGVAGERVREELLRLLAVPGNGQFFAYLDELGLLTVIFPELAVTREITQPKEHHWDVWQHSLETVVAVDFLLREGTWKYTDGEVLAAVPWSATLEQHFDQEISHGSTRRQLMKLAALLHDIAKPQTKAIDASGRMRFLGHAQAGADIAAVMLARLRFSSKEIKLVETEVKHHLRPVQMSQAGQLPSHRAIYRYFRDSGEAGIDTLFLSLADHLATRGPNLNLADWREHSRLVDYVINQHYQEESLSHPPKLVDGNDLINIFTLRPGPRIGEILEAVREAQASGEVNSREEALSLIDRLLTAPLS